MALKEVTVSGQVLMTSDGIAKTASPIAGSMRRREKPSMTEGTRKDERRDRFERKKKFKKITSTSKLKSTKQYLLTKNKYEKETTDGQTQ